jgi:hypothetical protein
VKVFLADAHKKAAAAQKNLDIDAETAYQIAYEAMLKASIALMLSHGQRPRVQLGHHIAIIEFAQKHLDPKWASTKEAVTTAEGYLQLIASDIGTRIG